MAVFPTKFVADAGTYTLATNASQALQLIVNGTTVLEEQYNVSPQNMQIEVRGLREVLMACLYGQMKQGQQPNASALVELRLGGATIESRQLYASRLRNPRDPAGWKSVLAAGDITAVCDPGGNVLGDGTLLWSRINGTAVMTSGVDVVAHDQSTLNAEVTIHRIITSCADRVTSVRFLNRYDVPQTMMSPNPLEIKPAFEDQVALMGGVRTRYSVQAQDEYTLRSGPVHSLLEYASWHDLMTSRLAQVWIGGHWENIVVTKSNYTQVARSLGLNPVEITFRLADPAIGV